MPGRVINSTSAVAVIIQAVSAPLRLDCATRAGRVSGAGAATAGAEATGTGACAEAKMAGTPWAPTSAAALAETAAGTAGASGCPGWAQTAMPMTSAQTPIATFAPTVFFILLPVRVWYRTLSANPMPAASGVKTALTPVKCPVVEHGRAETAREIPDAQNRCAPYSSRTRKRAPALLAGDRGDTLKHHNPMFRRPSETHSKAPQPGAFSFFGIQQAFSQRHMAI